MKWHYIPPVLLLAVAAVILAGGSRLARREQSVRVERDREPLRTFANSMQAELYRLEKLYENHLAQIARDVPAGSEYEVRVACGWLDGVRQVSILSTNQAEKQTATKHADKTGDRHFTISNPSGRRLPHPVLVLPKDKFQAAQCIVLPDEVRLAAVHESGWVEQPGNPVFFWHRRSAEHYVVILVDGAVVAECMNDWMKGWVSGNFHPVDAGTGSDQLLGPQNSLLAANGIIPENKGKRPDFVLPMNTRFGLWQLLSWDGWETHHSYHTPTLAASAALALLVALLGIGIFVQQRLALKRAAQRVSFINRVSHELRAPLTNILLNVDLAADQVDEPTGEIARRLALVQEEGRRLSRLIDNVLTFSRREQGRLQLHPQSCVPSDVIAAVIEQFAAALERRSIHVELEGGVAEACVFDPDAFAQILTNLVSNVEKYAAEGGFLGIRSRLDGNRLIVAVSDHGSGIPARDAEKIFRPFHRLHNEVNEGVSGTGLGLSIARELASRMGGTLQLLPSDTGAVFELTIPVESNAKATDNVS